MSDVEQFERALIDASTRVPVLMFYTSAVVWLLIGTLLAGFVSFKLHAPDLLSDISFLTWGRDASGAHERDGVRLGVDGRNGHGNLADGAIVSHGLASSASARRGRWILEPGRSLGRRRNSRRRQHRLSMARVSAYAAIILFVAYTLIMSWAVLMFRFRRGEQIYITQWYLLGAFLWFPWLYAAAQLMLFVVPVQGVMQAAVGWWYANNLLFLWFGAIGLGTAYYMIPESDRPPGLQLSSRNDRFLDLRAFLQLDRNATTGRWTVPGLDDHSQHRRDDSHDDSRRDRWAQSSHDDAGLFPAHALQPDPSFHRVRRDVLHGI